MIIRPAPLPSDVMHLQNAYKLAFPVAVKIAKLQAFALQIIEDITDMSERDAACAVQAFRMESYEPSIRDNPIVAELRHSVNSVHRAYF